MKIILNSGVVLNNVEPLDTNKSPIGLLAWSMKQSQDQVLGFKNMSIRASQIAAIQLEDGEFNSPYPYQQTDVNNQMPWNNN